jgi:ABC-2 type transport system ATP-binding protein
MTCERVIIIHEGKIVAEDRIENLSSIIGGPKRIRLEVEGPSEKVAERLRQIEGVHRVSYQDSHYTIECSAEQDPRGKIMETIVQSDWTLLSLESIEMSLEDIFLKLTTEEETSQ